MIIAHTENPGSRNPAGTKAVHYVGAGINRGKTVCGKEITEHWTFQETPGVGANQLCRLCQRKRERINGVDGTPEEGG